MVFSSINVSAETTIISNIEISRVASVPTLTFDDTESSRSNIGGIAIGKARNSMFVVKSSSDEGSAAFYYYPDISSPTNYAVYRLRYAGHANAMTVDNKNIYVAGWVKSSSNLNSNNTYNNWIIKIPRTEFGEFAHNNFNKQGVFIPKDNKNTETVEGFSVLYPKVKIKDSSGTISYNNYERIITSITKYKTDNSFIIGYKSIYNTPSDLNTNDFMFTTAKLENDRFIVSEDKNDIFVVKNNLSLVGAISQDICYSPNNGLFIPKWYGKSTYSNEQNSKYINPNKNVIEWADIDGTSSTTTINNITYRCYTPKKINVNVDNKKSLGVNMYSKFEIESIAFNLDNNLLFSCNVENTQDYLYEYQQKYNKKPPADGIFKLTYDNGKDFLLNN